jgi:hypothetical protein
MPGRTENNVKNRFNMMFKSIKDSFIKNRNHQSVYIMENNKDGLTENQIDEEKLINQLIEKKQKEIAEKQSSLQQSAVQQSE